MSAAPTICVLASGSAGNCAALSRVDGGVTLIDAGLSPRMTRQRLADVGLSWCSVTEILLTHTDRDHFHAGWPRALIHRPDVLIHVPEPHWRDVADGVLPRRNVRVVPVYTDGLFRAPVTTTIHAGAAFGVPLPHDALGTVGWRIEIDGAVIGHATDLGRVPDALIELFDGIDVLLLESNYDPPMQDASPRPSFLKQRIMGGHGHLSNAEAIDAALRIADRAPLAHIVLLHLSRECNCPRLVRALWESTAPQLTDRLVISDQHRPTPSLVLGKVDRDGRTSDPNGRRPAAIASAGG